MHFLLVFVILLLVEVGFFAIAKKFSIIDRPNSRSSHTKPVIRGGGIIFPLAAIGWFIQYQQNGYFITGLILVSFISFWDDVKSVSSKLRLAVQLIATGLLLYDMNGSLNSFSYMNLLLLFVITIALNLFNFMDGINGLTGLYNLGWLGSVAAMAVYFHLDFDLGLVWIETMAVLVFLYYNFRKSAACFAGDVGSVSIGMICCFVLGSLINTSHNSIPLLFLSVYMVDGVFTIVFRLIRKENIFQAHRSHLYQVLANGYGIDQRLIAVIYLAMQLLINVWAVYASSTFLFPVYIIFLQVLVLLVSFYLVLRIQIEGWKKLTGSSRP